MAIIGLTDRPAELPQLGTLRKGAPKPESGNKPGKDLEYFRFDSKDTEAVERFHEIYTDKPTAIRVYMPFGATDENFEAWREEWTASSLRHRCDGQTCVLSLTSNGTYSTEPLPCPHLQKDKKNKGCKQVGRLKVIIPELRRFAIVTALTTSEHDIRQLHANLLAIENFRRSRGLDLRGVPLILKRSPEKISTPRQNGERARSEKWLLSIEAQPEWAELQFVALDRAELPQAQPLALPEWDGEEDEIEEAAPVQTSAPLISEESIHYPQRSQPGAARDPRAKTLGDLVTPKQLWIIRGIGRELKLDVDRECGIRLQAKLEEIGKAAAGEFIDYLKSRGAVGPVESQSQPQPPETAADSLIENFVERIRSIIADQGKSQEWFAYHKKYVEGKDVPALAALLSRLEIAGSKKLIEEIEGPLFEALATCGVSGKEAIEKIAQIADGECGLEAMEYLTLVGVRDGMNAWLGQLKQEAATVAPF